MITAWCGPAFGGRFLNLTETAAFPRGEGEIVQATAFSTCTDKLGREDALEFQVCLEFGLLERFQVGFALPNVATAWSDETRTTEVGGTSFWGLYNFIDPETSGWGLSGAAVFGEDPEARSGELALLAEKPLGDWIVVYNGIAGRSWMRGDEAGISDAMTHSLGASFQASRSLFLGIEGNWFLEEDSGWETAGRMLGPNISVETGRLWFTSSIQFAVGAGSGVPDQLLQAQVGLPF